MVGAQSAQWSPPTSADVGRYFELRRQNLRGRRPVRADRRLGTDEKHIRAQSAILDKTPVLSLSYPSAGAAYAVPPTVKPSMRKVGWPTPTGTLWPSLPQVPTPVSRRMSLPIILTRLSASGPLPMSVAPFTG